MTRLILHPGFHKTGTSSVQAMLIRNRRLLDPWLRIILKPDILTVARLARRFSIERDPAILHRLRVRMRQFLSGLDRDDPRPILISCEDLLGHMPGRHGLRNYDAAIDILPALHAAALRALGGGCHWQAFVSTRDAEAWLYSNYWQNLRSTRLTQNFEDYRASLARAAAFDDVLTRTAEHLPLGTLMHMPLDDMVPLPHGPLSPLLELAGIDSEIRAQLVTMPPQNIRPDAATVGRFLEINRSSMDDESAKIAKKAEL